MQKHKARSLLFSIVAMLLITSCDSSIVKDTAPPSESQADSEIGAAINDSTKKNHNRYIVIFKEQPEGIASAQAAQQAITATNALFTTYSIPDDSLVHQYQWAIFGFAAELTKTQVKKLRNNPLIDHVVKDSYQKMIHFKPPEPEPNYHKNKITSSGEIVPWGVSEVYAPINSTSNDVWVIGTGVDVDHPDLNVDTQRSASFLADEGVDDVNGHGTAVAGLIAAKDNSSGVVGVTPGAMIIALKVLKQDGTGFLSDVIAAVDYAGGSFSPGDVVNLSLGARVTNDNRALANDLENSIVSAAEAGLKFTISAGNDDSFADNYTPAQVDHSNVYTLSAYDIRDDFASFSNYGNPPVDYGGPA